MIKKRIQPSKPRKHGKSRLEVLLEASIRQELATKRMWKEIVRLSFRLDRIERCPAVENDI
jgi:hypothetical protein